MKIVTGSSYFNDEKVHDFDSVRFVAVDGRTMFEVSICKDGQSIEARGVEVCKIGKVLYSEQLIVEPKVSNCVVIRTKPWVDK